MNVLTIPHDRGVRKVQYEEIIRIQGMSNYSKIYFIHGAPLVVAKVLHWFENSLPGEMFARIHKSHLINRKYVKEVSGIGYRDLLLHNGELIVMSRRKKLKLIA
jgi:two-component system, LytTR family, response regulator